MARPANGKTTATSGGAQQQRARRVRRYDLFCSDGNTKSRLQLTDEGVLPGVDALDFMLGRRWNSLPYHDIRSVTLESRAQPGSAPVGFCRIESDDGGELSVNSADAGGRSDGSRDGEFAAFVLDLHERLLLSGAAPRIVFRAEFRPWRRRILIAALAAIAALLVGVPLGMFVMTRRPEFVAAMLVGLGIFVPTAAVIAPHRRRGYRPDAPPTLFA